MYKYCRVVGVHERRHLLWFHRAVYVCHLICRVIISVFLTQVRAENKLIIKKIKSEQGQTVSLTSAERCRSAV